MPTIREKLQATITDDQLLTIHEWNQVAPEILDQWESGGQEALSQFLKEAVENRPWTIAPAILRLLQEKKIDRLIRLLQHGNLVLAKFVINAKYHKHHNIFAVRLGLAIAKNNLEAEELSHDLIKAFDLAFGRLIDQLRRVEKSRHDK